MDLITVCASFVRQSLGQQHLSRARFLNEWINELPMTFPAPWGNARGIQQSIVICVPLSKLRPRERSPGSNAWHRDRRTAQPGRAEEGGQRGRVGQALDLNTPRMVGEGISHTSIPFHSARPSGGLAGPPSQAGSSPQRGSLNCWGLPWMSF